MNNQDNKPNNSDQSQKVSPKLTAKEIEDLKSKKDVKSNQIIKK